MKNLNFEQMECLQGGKFWGSERECSQQVYVGEGLCNWSCWTNYYVFWIDVDTYDVDAYYNQPC